MRIKVGSRWLCVDEDHCMFHTECTVKEVNDEPGTNGDGEITVLYANGVDMTTKVRRFMPSHSRVLRAD